LMTNFLIASLLLEHNTQNNFHLLCFILRNYASMLLWFAGGLTQGLHLSFVFPTQNKDVEFSFIWKNKKFFLLNLYSEREHAAQGGRALLPSNVKE
jgi:hypothetical protein